MRNRLIVVFFGLWYATLFFAYEDRDILLKQITREQLKESLVMNQEWVAFPAYKDRKGWDVFLGEFKDYYIKRGESRLGYEWKVIKATDYIEFERSGNRRIMEVPFDSNNKAIADLLMAELAEGKGRFTDQLINGVFHCCEMTTWSLSAHMQNQKTKRALPSYSDPVFDLENGEVGNMLSWIYFFMKEEFDKVDPEITRRLKHELQIKLLNPYLNNNSFWWMARNKNGSFQNNWNPWCNSNALLAFMLLESDKEILTSAVYESMRSVDQYLNYINGDGACDEGPSYWGSSAGRLLDYLQMLFDITQGKVNVFTNQLISDMGEYICHSYVGNRWVVNFADASAHDVGDPYLAYRYGELVDSKSLMNYAGIIYGNYAAPVPSTSMYRVLKALEVKDRLASVSPEKITSNFTWYPITEFCYLANDDGVYVAAKGGYNDESHNHNDVGSFNLYIDQTPVLIDVGVGTYTRQTFSSERYNIWTMQSNYHNLPMINGIPEKNGDKYRSRNIIAKPNFFSLDISRAFPEAAQVEKWIRSYKLKRTEFEIMDDYSLLDTIAPNIINFMTWGDVAYKNEGQIYITINDVKVQLLYDASMFSIIIEPIKLSDPGLHRVWGDKIYRLSLKANKLIKKGKYIFKIQKL